MHFIFVFFKKYIIIYDIVLIKSEWEKRKGKQMRSSEGCSSPPIA